MPASCFGIDPPSPRVGLMTIGTEEGKGNALITETNELLKRVGRHHQLRRPHRGLSRCFAEHVDVVVCDGFVGNIMLKSWESLVKFISTMLKDEIKAQPDAPAGCRSSPRGPSTC
jgi:glycerol-3-phosphate acyltransferase PlsX